ncbi:hypothetical protein GAR05_05588 [Micromonospora saelicesensis]|uniref:Uncharacterized protein n=1 Tax=Micromonospora saelicesensis TaxID=285676 RepID=A0ABX9CB66_9ACTN|nr:hypothetical protein GAR05_05588 [Micromonospora saelicesensis]
MGGSARSRGCKVSRAAAKQKFAAMQQLAAYHRATHLGIPDYLPVAGWTSTPATQEEGRDARR